MSIPALVAPKKINLRRPEIMEAVQAQVISHYRSELVERFALTATSFPRRPDGETGEGIWVLLRRGARHRSRLRGAQVLSGGQADLLGESSTTPRSTIRFAISGSRRFPTNRPMKKWHSFKAMMS
jgi:hypothetical protein